MRVLIVEDDSSVAQSLDLMLKSESFNPYITDLGHEAVELAKIYDYDIVLLPGRHVRLRRAAITASW